MSTTRRTIVLVVCVVLLLVVLGFAVFGRDRSRGATKVPTPSSTAVVPVPPTFAPSTEGVVAASGRWPQTELGARRAAVSFVELTERAVSMTPADAAALQRSISSSRSADRLAADVEQKLTAIQTQVPDGLVVHVAPVALRATARGDGWDIAVWYAQVGVYGRQVAVEQWSTATYSLVWEGDTWRMDALVSTPGPVPTRPAALTATPTALLMSSLAGFDDEGLAP